MRFLADESCDFAVSRALRNKGHDVRVISEETKRSDDKQLIELAYREQRILLTEDKDFGWLVYVAHADSAGVILIRFPGNARKSLVAAVCQLVAEQEKEIAGAFAVIQPGHVRIGRHPKD